MKAIKIIIIFLIFCTLKSQAQTVTQTIKGKIIDKESQVQLPGATVVILNTNPIKGATSDLNGDFIIKDVPVGRYNIQITFISYEPILISELLVGSGKEVVITAEMKESVKDIKEVIIKADKSSSLNSMTTVSARQFTVEEASRYAGGYSDPARLASSFAGVSSNISDNGIVIRGNSPKGLLWRMEGVEISNPSHFANIGSLGAGAITALSSQVLANSDFLTGAFPAEYGNALSGVFDLKLRTGNNDKRESAIQVGLAGIDFSSEGPFKKGSKASYLFNYRYSTFALLAPILPPEMGKLKYQDLSFKMNFPTEKAGIFSIWGVGALDYQGREAVMDSLKWEMDVDKQQYATDLYMNAIGANHKFIIGSKTFVNTTFANCGNGLILNESSIDNSMILKPMNKINNKTQKFTFSSFINHKFNAKHTNKTGFIADRLQYNMLISSADSAQNKLIPFVNSNGYSYLIQFYSQSRYSINEKLNLNIGIHSQFFTLNNHYSLEPRIGASWKVSKDQTIGISYGLHSQIEILNYYLVRNETLNGISEPNKNLDFSKANHFIASYELKLSSNSRLKIEPYYQQLFNVPVIPNSCYSLINLQSGLYFNDSLVNKGKGRNIGIDVTLERFLNKGYYYLVTASIFDSKYIGGDGIERNSRFDKNYVLNLLGGKEWNVGKGNNNVLSVNAKVCFMGGDKFTPFDVEQSYAQQSIVEDNSNAFTKKKSDAQVLSLSISYRKNKPHHASIIEFSFINVLGYKEITRYYFDKTSNKIMEDINQLVVPNLSYRIEF
ncbi:MAG: TonB-dependent receptor [Bacteroidota bacterium]